MLKLLSAFSGRIAFVMSISFFCACLVIWAQDNRIETLIHQRNENKAQLLFCIDNHKINQKVSHAYETKINTLNSRYLELFSLYGAIGNIPVHAAGGPDDSAAGFRQSGGCSIAAAKLLSLAKRSDELEEHIFALQDWINTTTKTQGD